MPQSIHYFFHCWKSIVQWETLKMHNAWKATSWDVKHLNTANFPLVLKRRVVSITKLLIYLQGYWKGGEDGDSFNICLTYLLPYRWVPAFWLRLGGFTPGTPLDTSQGNQSRTSTKPWVEMLHKSFMRLSSKSWGRKVLQKQCKPVSLEQWCRPVWRKGIRETVDGNQKSGKLTSWGWQFYSIIYRVWDTSQVVVRDFFHQQYEDGWDSDIAHFLFFVRHTLVVLGIRVQS